MKHEDAYIHISIIQAPWFVGRPLGSPGRGPHLGRIPVTAW